MTHAEISELLGAYALDAVSRDEALEIELHLADCPRCRAELAAHREVAGVLGNSSGTAPAGLWSRIADELALGSDHPSVSGVRDLQSPAPPALGQLDVSHRDALAGPANRESDGSGEARPAPVIAIGSAQSLRPVSSRGRGAPERDRHRSTMFGAAAAVAVVLAIVVGALSAKVVSLDSQMSALNSAVRNSGVTSQVAAAELNPQHVNVELTSVNSAWSALVVVVPGGEAFLMPGRMPALGAGQTYQAWALLKNGQFRSLGVFARSGAAMQLQSPMTEVLVNTEPEGGTSQPTTAPFLSGTLPTSF